MISCEVSVKTGNKNSALLEEEVARVRQSGLIGETGRLTDLFDYLVKRTLSGDLPRETDIAFDVFGRSASDQGEDSSVRVYIHRLRKRIEEVYLRTDQPVAQKLVIPRGEYRLALVNVDSAEAQAGVPVSATSGGRPTWLVPAFVGALAAALGFVLAALLLPAGRADRSTVEASPLWEPIITTDRDVVLVVGDYYIFGEYTDGLFLDRLVRDFQINSAADLARARNADPQAYREAADVALEYLPTSIAFSLVDFLPALSGKNIHIELASQLTPDDLKCCDVVYLGLTSGLASLQDTAFRGSRFRFGDTYDEIVDLSDGEEFVSNAFLGASEPTIYQDYAIFLKKRGPTDNWVYVFAGMRDTGLMGLTESLGSPDYVMQNLPDMAGEDYEALFQITGQRHVNLSTELLRDSRD